MTREQIHRWSSKWVEYSCYFLATSLALSLAGNEIGITSALIGFIVKKLSAPKGTRKAIIPETPVNKWIFLFGAYCLLSLLWGDHLYQNFRGILKYGSDLFIFFLILDTFRTPASCKRMVYFILFGAVLTSLNGIYQYFQEVDLLRERKLHGQRIRSIFKTPNDFSEMHLLIIPLALLQFTDQMKKHWITYGAICLILVTGFLLASSRNPLFCISVVGCFILMTDSGIKKAYKWGIIAAMIVGTLFVKMPNNTSVFALLNFKTSSAIQERSYLWKIAVRMIKDKPILGHGANSYSQIHLQYFPNEPNFYGRYIHLAYPHNSYLKIWIEIGLLGLFLYGLIYFMFFGYILNRKKKLSGHLRWRCNFYLISILAFLMSAVFDTYLSSSHLRSAFWVIMGLLATEIRLADPTPTASSAEADHRSVVSEAPTAVPQT